MSELKEYLTIWNAEGKRKTRTSKFGSPGRINHDSTPFYRSKLYKSLPGEKKIKYVENPIPENFLNKIFCKSSEKMDELPDSAGERIKEGPLCPSDKFRRILTFFQNSSFTFIFYQSQILP